MGFSDSVIIFHPGSRHLYFGRSSDSKPQSILHVIARRQNISQNGNSGSNSSTHHRHRDTLVPLSEKRMSQKIPHEVESARLQLALTLQSIISSTMASNPNEYNADAAKLSKQLLSDVTDISTFNKLSKPVVSVATGICSSIPNFGKKDNDKLLEKSLIVGEDVLKLKREDPFNIHCPWRRGQLNLHRKLGGSITSVVQDMEDIWRWCLTEKLGITQKEIKNCSAIVVIPVMFDRVHAKELMSLIVNRLGFQRCFFLQDHICASFGAGISCCTVVDVGDQKISVSCVEDGVSYPHSRLELKYGGGDLTIALWNQLSLNSFPMPMDVTDLWDWEFFNKLKETRCHLNVKSWIKRGGGPVEDTILWTKPKDDSNPTEYRVQFGDELMIVPLSYFNPDLLRGSIGRKAVISYGPQPSIPDDPHDQNFLADVVVKRPRKDSGEDGNGEDENASGDETCKLSSNIKSDTFDLPLGIDQAILQSINICNIPDDLKRRLYSCILVVGGGFKINGLHKRLSDRLKLSTPKYLSTEPNSTAPQSLPNLTKVITCAADMKNALLPCVPMSGRDDPSIVAWKGAAILSSLDTAKELWITREEWDTHGSKILREKSLFHF